jgi:hypothetical protein
MRRHPTSPIRHALAIAVALALPSLAAAQAEGDTPGTEPAPSTR